MHLFRRYINNRGSALFMVISVMTAIMVSCMAMYFSVVSSRSSQYAVFNQQQSKQSAVSISEAVMAQLMDGKMNSLLEEMYNLKVGEKLTTNGNGFAAFGVASGKEDDDNLGAYMIEVIRTAESTFDIMVTSSVNGVSDVYHTVFDLTKGEAGTAPPAKTQMFAATGYVPNDVFMETSLIYADLFFDNELTTINTYDGAGTDLYGDVSAGGSVSVVGILKPSSTTPVTYAIRGNYIFEKTANAQSLSFKSSPNSTILVGGDLVISDKMGASNVDIYVLGDVYCFSHFSSSGEIFVDGDVYLAVPANAQYFHTNGNVYALSSDSTYTNVKTVSYDSTYNKAKGIWDGTKSGYLSVGEMVDELDSRTQTNTYYKWILDDTKISGLSKVVDLNYNNTWDHPVNTIEMEYSDSNQGCTINKITCTGDGSGGFTCTNLVIDTGEDENNIYTIRVKANRDTDGDGTPDTFTWQAEQPNNWGYTEFYSGWSMNIIVKGRGSVVIDVPEGVVYQDAGSTRVMHYGWFLLGGGSSTVRTGTSSYQKPDGSWASEAWEETIYSSASSYANVYRDFIHQHCTKGDGCTYETENSTNKCEVHQDTAMKVLKCGVHGQVDEFCPTCTPKSAEDYYGSCSYRVGRKEIDNYLASHDDIRKLMLDKKGQVIYPTTNIFLVSCEESAEFRFASTKDEQPIGQNLFFGYIYAPYMTYRASRIGSGAGQYARIIGGMTVSDYSLDEPNELIACWPEKLPTDLMSDESKKNQLDGFTNKDWKLDLRGH